MGRITPKAALAAVACVAAATTAAADQAPRIGPDSGLPVPRIVSLDADNANGRRRPETGAPVDWVYHQQGLPLRVVAEAGPWRRVRDPLGAEVWMHKVNLEETPAAYVLGGHRGELVLRSRPSVDSRAVAIVARGVAGRVVGCADGWVEVDFGRRQGWARADHVWGAETCGG